MFWGIKGGLLLQIEEETGTESVEDALDGQEVTPDPGRNY